jgi:penicillin-binding protein 1A
VRSITAQTQASNNCAFLRLGQVVGLSKVVDVAKRLGITSQLEQLSDTGGASFIPKSLPLGSRGVRPFDMAAAYSVFANDGVRNTPYLIERIEDSKGRVLYQHQAAPQRVISSDVARLVNQVLVANVEDGTGTKAKLFSGQPAAGKTGTTNRSSDVWFVGYTPQMATAIWMGAPKGNYSLDGAGIAGATGGKYPAATWGSYTTQLLAGQPRVGFPPAADTRPGRSVGKVPSEIPFRSSYLNRGDR